MSYERMSRHKEYWLCADGSLIPEPEIERTPAGRRVRVAGYEESVARGDLPRIIYQWVYRKARRNETVPVLRLRHHPEHANDDELRDLIGGQVGRTEHSEHFAPFKENTDAGTAQWVFEHPRLPVYAKVQMSVQLSWRARVETNLSFPNMRPGNEQSHSGGVSYRRSINDEVPHYSLSDLATAYKEVVDSNDITFGSQDHPNTKAAMADAIRRYREVDALDHLNIPDLRTEGQVGRLQLHLREAMQPDSFLQEMQEYAHVLDPANEIAEHWGAIMKLLKRQGVPVKRLETNAILGILTGAKDALRTELAPVRMQDGNVVKDGDHHLTLDLMNGIVFVRCSTQQQDKEKDVLAYEIARARAEMTGETDLLEAFMASIGKARAGVERMKLIDAARSDA